MRVDSRINTCVEPPVYVYRDAWNELKKQVSKGTALRMDILLRERCEQWLKETGAVRDI